MKPPLAKSRRRRRSPALEALEDRRLMAYAPPAPVMTIAEGAAAGAGAFRAQFVGTDRVFVAWEEDAGAGTGLDVYARWYHAGGVPIGDAFRVNDEAAGDQAAPRVETAPDGGVVVSWWSESGVEYRRYSADGSAGAGPIALPGTAGLSRDYDLFGVAGDGLSIYARGFQIRRFTLDGVPTFTLAQAPVADGWTLVESDAGDRAEYSGGLTAVTWSEVRPDPGGAGYDSRVMVGYFDAGVRRYVVKTYEDGDAAFADDLDPRFLGAASMIAWVGASPAGGRWIEESEFLFGSDPSFAEDLGEWLPGMPPDGTPTAVDADGAVYIHSVRPGATGGAESYFRVWRHHYVPGPGWPRYSGIPGYWYWDSDGEVATPDIPPEAIGSMQFVLQDEDALWLVWNGPEGGLHAQRFFSDVVTVGRTGPVPKAGEADGAATVQLKRTGDLARPLTLRYRSFVALDRPTSLGPALPGYDFVPVEGEVTFEAESATATISIPLLDDAAADGDKAFLIEVTDPAGKVSDLPSFIAVEIIDDEPAELASTTFFDYGDAGLWSFNEVAGWAKLNDLAPRSMLATPGGTLYLDYGAAGLWSWDGVRLWRKLNDVAPESMAYGAGDRLILDYGAAGLWTLHDVGGWAHINPADPVKVVADPYSLLVDFGAAGVWAWSQGDGYRQVSLASPEGMAVAHNQYYFDFGPGGLWTSTWTSNPLELRWTQISPLDPQSIAVASDSDAVYIDFGAGGLRRWNPSYGGVELLSAWDPSEVVVGGRISYFAPIYMNFPVRGVWRWGGSEGFLNPTPYQAAAIAAGSGDAVVLAFESGGVWRWSPTAGWRKLNDLSPRAIART
ncbi:MAG: hypothetical protein BGO49_03935 [Planctomycetales bacterium 71-10]|nr:MAG: hypothetical protein BGO49_03935 [Planctomycetales bacterium 71-10]